MIDALPYDCQAVPAEIFIVNERYQAGNARGDNIDAIIAYVNSLEQTIENLSLNDHPNQEITRQLINRIVQLAQLGSRYASAQEQWQLNRDILALLMEEESGIGFERYEGYLSPHDYFYASINPFYQDHIILSKSFWKRIKHIAHKVKEFVKEHKKEIIIAAAVLTGVGIAAYAILGNSSEEVREPPRPPEPAEPSKPAPAPSVSASEEKPIPQAIEAPHEESSLINQLAPPAQEASITDTGKEVIRMIGSLIAHEIWDGLSQTGEAAYQFQKDVRDVGGLITPHSIWDTLNAPADDLPSLEQRQEDWTNQVVKGHQKIDEWFATSQSDRYDPQYKEHHAKKFTVGTLPPPLFTPLQEAEAGLKIASAIRNSEAFTESAAIAEDLAASGRQVHAIEKATPLNGRVAGVFDNALTQEIQGIRIQPNGVWEIEGITIKKFDLCEMLEDNRVNHIFGNPEHNLDKLKLTPQAAYTKITQAIVEAEKAGKIQIVEYKPFKVFVNIDGHEIEARGIVIDGTLKYSTFFIPNN